MQLGPAYGDFLGSLAPNPSTSALASKTTDKLVSEFRYVRANATGTLAQFMDYLTYGYMIDNVALLITGPVILWRSRRADGSRGQRYRRRTLAAVCAPVLAVAIGWFLVFPISVGYIYTHTAPEPAEPDLRSSGLERSAACVLV